MESAKAFGRVVIGYENKTMLPNKIFVKPGSIKMKDEKIPISVAFRHEVPPIGWASDLQVNKDGEISVQIELTDLHTILLV